MQQIDLAEKIVKLLTGTTVTVHFFDATATRTIEDPHPEKKTAYGLSFPGSEEIARKWEKYLKKNDLSFSLAEPLIFAFCKWWKANQK